MEQTLARAITAISLIAAVASCVSAIDENSFACKDDNDCPDGQQCLEVDYTDMCMPDDWCGDDDHCRSDEYCDLNDHECEEYDLCDNYIPGSDNDDCCVEEDICDLEYNDVCDCGGNCEWDWLDCD